MIAPYSLSALCGCCTEASQCALSKLLEYQASELSTSTGARLLLQRICSVFRFRPGKTCTSDMTIQSLI